MPDFFALLMERCWYLTDKEVLFKQFECWGSSMKTKEEHMITQYSSSSGFMHKQLGFSSPPLFTFLKLFYRSSMGSMILIYYTLAINQRGWDWVQFWRFGGRTAQLLPFIKALLGSSTADATFNYLQRGSWLFLPPLFTLSLQMSNEV